MKNLIFFLILVLGFISCQKEEETPQPKPTIATALEIEAGYVQPTDNLILLKSQNWWDENGIRITWNSNLGNGQSPMGPITLSNGESMQLSYEFLEPPITGGFISWYTNDQQVASVNWQGLLTGTWIGPWFPGYSNITVIYLYYYRPNPNYNGHNKKYLTPYVDNVHVYVID